VCVLPLRMNSGLGPCVICLDCCVCVWLAGYIKIFGVVNRVGVRCGRCCDGFVADVKGRGALQKEASFYLYHLY
jgi:hypothetical protein